MNRTLFLGVDTSTMWLNLSLVTAEGHEAGAFHERVGTHASRLLPAVDRMLVEASRDKKALKGIGAVVGPGSFTGLRVGLASVLGLCSALGIPAFGIDSLTALALSCRQDGEGLAVMDARRGEVYVRRFRKNGDDVTPLDEARAIRPGDVPAEAWTPSWMIGDGVPLVAAWSATCERFAETPNLAERAALHAAACTARGLKGDALSPAYVRAPDVRKPASFRPGG